MNKTSVRFAPAHQFNYHVATVFDDFFRARGEKSIIDARALFFQVSHQYLRNVQIDSGAIANESAVLVHQLHQTATHSFTTQQPDVQLLPCQGCTLSCSSGAPPAIDGTSRTSSPSWKA